MNTCLYIFLSLYLADGYEHKLCGYRLEEQNCLVFATETACAIQKYPQDSIKFHNLDCGATRIKQRSMHGPFLNLPFVPVRRLCFDQSDSAMSKQTRARLYAEILSRPNTKVLVESRDGAKETCSSFYILCSPSLMAIHHFFTKLDTSDGVWLSAYKSVCSISSRH